MDTSAPPCPVCGEDSARFFAEVDARVYWRCETCEATYLSPPQRPDRDEEKREYDQHQNAIDDPGYRTFLARLADPLLERLPPNSEGLDYGCGPGPALAAMLSEAGHRMSVWDPIYYPDEPVLKHQYDFVTCTEVVEHMHQPLEEFRRIDHLLRPGGLFGVMTMFQTDDAKFAGWHYRRDPTHVMFFRVRTMTILGQVLGWRVQLARQSVMIFLKAK